MTSHDLAPLMAASRTVTAAVVRSLTQVTDKVSVAQLRVLVMLSSRGRLNMSSVADGLGVNVSNASRACDKLVKAGLVDRQVDPHDRRHASLALTREGRRLVDDVMEHRARLLAAVVAEMPEASLHTLMEGLAAFNAAALRLAAATVPADETSTHRVGHAGPDKDSPEHVEGNLAQWLI